MTIERILRQIEQRILPDGGVLSHLTGDCRADSTAWAIIACGEYLEFGKSRERLAGLQCRDGRVPLVQEQTKSWWTTPLAVMAWSADHSYADAQLRAVNFLLSKGGEIVEKSDIIGDNTEIQGWSWVEGTCSWVEPTCMALLALEAAGIDAHPRITEGRRLLADRMLAEGGWNFGNKSVFGKSFAPIIEYTGMGACTLKEEIGREERARIMACLRGEYQNLRTPIALSWATIGLSAINARPAEVEKQIKRCLDLQKFVGEYDTVSLSLLLMALHDNPLNGADSK